MIAVILVYDGPVLGFKVSLKRRVSVGGKVFPYVFRPVTLFERCGGNRGGEKFFTLDGGEAAG
jgi:hypothetical protein